MQLIGCCEGITMNEFPKNRPPRLRVTRWQTMPSIRFWRTAVFEKMEARNQAASTLTNEIVRAVTSGHSVLDSERVVRQIISEIENRKHSFLSEQQGGDRERAEAWVGHIQERVLQALSSRIGQLGGDVSIRLLELTVAELKNAVVPELDQEADVDNRLVSTTNQRIHGKFANFDGQVLPDNPLIRESVKEGVRS